MTESVNMADLIQTFWTVYWVIFILAWFTGGVLGFCALITQTIEDSVELLNFFKYGTLWPILPLVWLIKVCVRRAKVLKLK